MERFNFLSVEKKWSQIFKNQKLYRPNPPKILLFRNVSISVRKNTHGSC